MSCFATRAYSVLIALGCLTAASSAWADPSLSVQGYYESTAVVAGNTVQLRFTVSNGGNEDSKPTFVRLHRANEEQTFGNTSVLQSAKLPALFRAPREPLEARAGGYTHEVVFQQRTESRPGEWFYGACVQRVPGASDTEIRCSDPVRVTTVKRRLDIQDEGHLLPGQRRQFEKIIKPRQPIMPPVPNSPAPPPIVPREEQSTAPAH